MYATATEAKAAKATPIKARVSTKNQNCSA
ncbi:Uncharacterised protein [Vibrio cholerae]|nr:Uncharacterised protein [Vibrio cholerae]CSH83945.1 Uncharacterised protein [Vibrio cholerae]